MPKKQCPVCKITFKTKYLIKSSDGNYYCPNRKKKCKTILPKEWFDNESQKHNPPKNDINS